MIEKKAPSRSDIESAYARIRSHIHRTPVLRSSSLDAMFKANLYFKCENFQKTGSFKMRGAANAVFSLDEAAAAGGVVTHSSGNHAQALAFAARQRGISCRIVMPENAPSVKIAAVRDFGAEIRFCEPTQKAREQAFNDWISESGGHIISPFDDPRIIAGQASAAMELIDEIPGLDYIFCPTGGGGLTAGSILSAGFYAPNCRIAGTEPERANDAFDSLRTGILQPATNLPTLADGLRTGLSQLTFGIIQSGIDRILLASEPGIVQTMGLMAQRLKIFTEPSSAVPLAALSESEDRFFEGKKVGIVLSGGNANPADWGRFFSQ